MRVIISRWLFFLVSVAKNVELFINFGTCPSPSDQYNLSYVCSFADVRIRSLPKQDFNTKLCWGKFYLCLLIFFLTNIRRCLHILPLRYACSLFITYLSLQSCTLSKRAQKKISRHKFIETKMTQRRELEELQERGKSLHCFGFPAFVCFCNVHSHTRRVSRSKCSRPKCVICTLSILLHS